MASSTTAEARVVRKAGEGYDKPNGEQELPIDINYQKLAEWLVARQKLPQDWHKRLQAIQAKVTEAVKELPSGVLAQVAGSADAPVDYFRAVQIRDKLAETGERSLFGGLTGAAGTWDKVVKAYENGGVFIGEAALTMIQNVDYEVPYLRKQMAKCSQQMADAERRQAEYARSAAQCATNYKKECEQLGISGSTAVQQELKQLSHQLPSLFDQIVADLRSSKLQPVVNYYQHFTAYAHSSNADKAAAALRSQQSAAAGAQDLPAVLPVLTEVRDGTTAPWKGGSAAADAANNAAAAAAAPAIDWGMGDAAAADGGEASGGVDWGISAAETAAGGDSGADGGISWDLGDLTAAAGGADAAGDAAGGAAGISWDVSVEPEAAEQGAEAGGSAAAGPSLNWDIDLSGIDMEESSQGASAAAAGGIDWGVDTAAAAAGSAASAGAAGGSGGAASSDASAARLQLDSEYRSQLLDDLQEIQAFLLSRKAGLTGSSSSQDLLRALAPDVVASTDARDVGQMLQLVQGLLSQLNADKLRQLLMISSSARYVDRLSSSLQRKAGQEAKMLAAAAETQARQQESRAMLASLQPKLSEIVGRTRTIKTAVEGAVSKQFAGRRVNVLGEINNALSAAC